MTIATFLRFAVPATCSFFLLAGCSAEARKERILKRATAHFEARDYAKAEIEYQNVLQLDPNNAIAIEHLGLVWLERGAPLRAAAYLGKIRTLRPDDLDNRGKFLHLLVTLGKRREARADATAVLERFPNNADALAVLAETVGTREENAAAEKIMRVVSDRNSRTFHLANANLALHRGDIALAKAALERAKDADPKSPEVHLAMAIVLVGENKPAEAGQEFKTAAKLAPIRSVARLKDAEFKAQTGAVDEAIASLKEITQQAPDYFPAWRALAQIAIAQKKYDVALSYLQNVFSRDSVDYEAQLVKTQLWLAQGENKKAIDLLEQMGKTFPELAGDKYQLGLAYLQQRDFKEAASAFARAIAQNPDHDQAILQLARLNLRAGDAKSVVLATADLLARRPYSEAAQLLFMDAMAALGRLDDVVRSLREGAAAAPQQARPYYLLGLVLARQGKAAEARENFEKSLELAPDNLPVVTELVGLDLRERNFAKATQRVEEHLAKSPNSAKALYLDAQIRATQGLWDQAETLLLKAIELDPNYVLAYEMLTTSYVARKQRPEVIGRMESFLAARPNDPNALVLAARVYVQLNELTKARDAFEKHIRLKPDSAAVLNDLAYLYDEQLHQPDRALELARRARALEPDSPAIADTVGWILFKRKEYTEALELIKESAAKLTTHPEIQYHLGRANQMMGNKEEARRAFQKAMSDPMDFPGKDEIARRLTELDQPSGK